MRAPKGVLTPDVVARLREHKGELLKLLSRPGRPSLFEVPAGWSREGWIKRLRYLAAVCILPERARELGEWADALAQDAPKINPN